MKSKLICSMDSVLIHLLPRYLECLELLEDALHRWWTGWARARVEDKREERSPISDIRFRHFLLLRNFTSA